MGGEQLENVRKSKLLKRTENRSRIESEALFFIGFSSFHFSPLTDWIAGGHNSRFSRDPLPVFCAGGPREQLWHGQGCPLFDVVHPAFPLPTAASSTLQGALKGGFGHAVEACDITELCKFPSPDSCQNRLLWTHKGDDLAPGPVDGLVLQVGDAEKFPQALRFENLNPSFFFFQSQQAGSMFHSHRGGWRWQET